MTQTQNSSGELNWLLDGLVDKVADVRQAVVLSSDGLLMGASRDLTREDAEHLSAVAASFASLARGAARQFSGGGVRQTIIEMDNAFLFVTSAGQGACLALLTGSTADVGMVAYEMAMLVTRVGQHLTAHPRVRVPGGE